MDAETEKIRADTEKVKAETSQTDTDNDIKRRRERWKKWFVRGIAVLLLLVTFTLIALTITGKIDWSAVVRYLISCTLVLLRLFIKAKLEKE